MLLQELKNSQDWNPTFHWTEDVELCADTINRPHEDYPDRVEVTKDTIMDVVGMIHEMLKMEERECIKLVERDILNMHNQVMKESYIQTGRWRISTVELKNQKGETVFTPPPAINVPMLMMSILPVTLDTNLEEWYSDFQTVHPFEDGNGRVGAIIIAAISFINTGKFLTPG